MSQPVNEFPVIVVAEGELRGKHWMLEYDSMVLGRDETCDMVVPLRQISRQHMRFRRVDVDRYVVEDLDSKNGTWVNGNRVEGSASLSDGDEIHVTPKLKLRFLGAGVTAPLTRPDLPPVIARPASDHSRLKIDMEARRVFIHGVEVNPPLSFPQYRLLELLYTNASRVCSREEVVEYVWPEVVGDGVSEQAIDALVRRLRDRLGELDPGKNYITTVRGHGFRLEQE
jgi:hypothetical protein